MTGIILSRVFDLTLHSHTCRKILGSLNNATKLFDARELLSTNPYGQLCRVLA